jgi:hypothetical protein
MTSCAVTPNIDLQTRFDVRKHLLVFDALTTGVIATAPQTLKLRLKVVFEWIYRGFDNHRSSSTTSASATILSATDTTFPIYP